MTAPRLTALLLVLGVALGPGCGADDGGEAGAETGTEPITIGSKIDTEAQLLAHLATSVLENRGYDVETKIPLGGTDLIRRALLSGDIDLYWEFTGTGLALLGENPIGDPAEAYEKARRLDADNGVTWLPAAAMNDTYALAVAGDGSVPARTLSELTAYVGEHPDTGLCVDPEGGFREDVLPALRETYGLEWENTRQLGSALIPPALADGQCAVGIVYSTSALIVKHGLRVLEDDREAFGAYTPAPTVLTERLDRWPSLAEDLAGLTAALDTPTITELNARVDVEGEPAEAVAEDFLRGRGLLDAED